MIARLIYWIERWHDWRERRGERRGSKIICLYPRLRALQRMGRW